MRSQMWGWMGALLLLQSGMSIAEGTKIAFVNTPVLAESSPQAKAAVAQLEKEFAKRKQQLDEELKAAKEIDSQLVRDGAVMSAQEKRDLERDLTSRQREFKLHRDAFEEDFVQRQREELGKMQREIAAVVVDIAKKGGFDLVLEAGVVYASPEVDITQQVIDALNKAAPSKR